MAEVVGFTRSQNIIVKSIIIYDTITKKSPYAAYARLREDCVVQIQILYILPHNK